VPEADVGEESAHEKVVEVHSRLRGPDAEHARSTEQEERHPQARAYTHATYRSCVTVTREFATALASIFAYTVGDAMHLVMQFAYTLWAILASDIRGKIQRAIVRSEGVPEAFLSVDGRFVTTVREPIFGVLLLVRRSTPTYVRHAARIPGFSAAARALK